jgi:hypothetical protein
MSSINYADLSELYEAPTHNNSQKYYFSKEWIYCHRKNTIQPYNDNGKTSYCKMCNREFSSMKLCDSYSRFSKKCIYCKKENTYPIINDGGSVAYCNLCKKSFKAVRESA